MRARVKPDDKRRDGGLRKKQQGGRQEAEGVETEQKKRKRGRERESDWDETKCRQT